MEKNYDINFALLLFMLVLIYLLNLFFPKGKRLNRWICALLYSQVFILVVLFVYFSNSVQIKYYLIVLLTLVGFFGGKLALIFTSIIGIPLYAFLFNDTSALTYFTFTAAILLGILYHTFLVRQIIWKKRWLLFLFAVLVQAFFILSIPEFFNSFGSGDVFRFITFNVASVLVLFGYNLFMINKSDSPTDDKLKQAEEKYSFLLERISGAVLKVDYLGRITYANKYLLNLLNVSLPEIKGKQAVGMVFNAESDARNVINSVVDSGVRDLSHRFESQIINNGIGGAWLSWDCKIADDTEHLLEILFTGVDITEWKSDEIPKYNIDHANQFIEKFPLPMVSIDVDTDSNLYINRYNNAAANLLGLSKEFYAHQKFIDVLPFLNVRELPVRLIKTAIDGTDFCIDILGFKRDNTQYYIEIRAFQVKSLTTVIILTDISQRIKDKEALELSEQKFRTVITENPMVFFMLDKNGIFTLSEGLGLAKLGLKPGQVVGLSVFDVYKDFPEIVESSKKSLNGFSVKLDLKVGDIHYNTVFTPVFDERNQVKNVLGVAYDITSRINAEKEVERKSEELERYFNNSLDLLCIADLQGYFRKVNPEWSKLLGYSPKELEGKRFFDFIHSDDIEVTNTAIKELSDMGSVLNFTNRYITKQGDYRWIEWRSFLDNNLVYAVARDITERRLAEEQIIENDRRLKEQNEEYIALNEELSESNQRIKEINQKLIDATEKAQESDRLKSSFLANMSHEIRTPMNGIVGFCQLLKQTNAVDEQVARYCDIIATSSNQLLSIINDIIDISKIEAGHVDLKQEPVSIMSLIKKTTSLYQALASQNSIDLKVNLDTDSRLVILSDETKISQILGNLINNAIKFTKQGFVEVSAKESPKCIEISVSDSGIGIAKEDQKLIFDRFRQIDGANPNSMKGTGLGLSISKSLVEILGGTIWVDSDLGKGATFKFTIPNIKAMDEFEAVKRDDEIPEKFNLGGISILLAEDDNINKLLLRRALESANAKVILANNGEEAVALVKSNNDIKLILMDIKMPVMDGLEATLLIKSKYPKIPIVAQTAYALPDERKRAIDAGCDAYLTKPINITMLYKTIQQLI